MGKQANILSFDEVKRGASTRRSSAVVPKSTSRSRYSRAPYIEASAAYPKRGFAPPRTAEAKRAPLPLEQENLEEEVEPEKRSRIKEMRRKRQKDRAEKKFNKQFGGSQKPSDASSGPRAAVYKGEMGSTHKRAARTLNEGSATRASAKRSPAGVFTSLRQSPKFIASAAVVVCLVLACGFLYTPTQQLYHSVREHDRLQAEYSAIEQRNSSLQSEVGSLNTESGIEDRAHSQFGWIPEGHQTANVKGLSGNSDDASNFTANIVPGSIEAPITWYSPFLDAIFGAK